MFVSVCMFVYVYVSSQVSHTGSLPAAAWQGLASVTPSGYFGGWRALKPRASVCSGAAGCRPSLTSVLWLLGDIPYRHLLSSFKVGGASAHPVVLGGGLNL